MEMASVEDLWKWQHVLTGSIFENAGHKFGSNVVEKLLDCIIPAQALVIMDKFLEDAETTRRLCIDQFGNYVIQKLMTCGTKTQRIQVQVYRSVYINGQVV